MAGHLREDGIGLGLGRDLSQVKFGQRGQGGLLFGEHVPPEQFPLQQSESAPPNWDWTWRASLGVRDTFIVQSFMPIT